jgi:pyruvate dehydrogenase E1 component alpha subunit
MAELTGRIGGLSRGKGGSMHMFSKEKNFYGGHGIVGAQVPLGTGLAFANKYRGNDNVSLAYFGDGAANQGQVYEAFNMASLWKLPVIYVIENNMYAMGTSVERASAEVELYKRGISFEIEGEEVDGMDVLAVREAGEKAVKHARAGKGPYILEMKTYRYRGHSMSDPAKYRKREEVDDIRTHHDPIEGLKGQIIELGHATEDDLKKIDNEIKAIVKEAADFSLESPEPDASELWTDVLIEETAGESDVGHGRYSSCLGAVAHHGGGHALQMAAKKEGDVPSRSSVRRHHRRDRNRQGDDGSRGRG